MIETVETRSDSGENEGKPPRGRRRGRRVLVWIVGGLVVPALVLILLVLGVLWFAKGQDFAAPDWIKDRIEVRLAEFIPDIAINFDDLTLTVSDEWQPSLHLTSVRVVPPGTGQPVTLADVTGSFDPAALLQGMIRPRVITVTGARIQFSRDQAGSYTVAFGTPAAEEARARDIAQSLDSLTELLNQPSFSALRRIEGEALTVRYEDQRSGRAWTVDGGRLHLSRLGNALRLRGDFALLGGYSYATTAAVSVDGEMGSRAASLALRVEDMPASDIATQSAGLAWLGVLDAPISGSLRVTTDEAGIIGPLDGTLLIGEGALAPGNTRDPVPFKSARSYFQYDPASTTLRFDELAVQSAWVEATAEGRIVLADISDGIPGAMTGQLRLTELTTNPGGIYPAPIFLEGADVEMRVKLDPFRLDVGRFDLRDRGATLALKGWFAVEEDGWDVSVTGRSAEMSADDLLELWPQSALVKTREWVARNVLDGVLHNIQFGVRSAPTSRPDVVLGFDFEDVITTFLPSIPPIESASGHAELRDDRFVVTADNGVVYAPDGEGIRIAGTTFIYENTRVKRGPAEVRVRADGAIGDVLTLLDLKPLFLLTKAGRDAGLATGEAEIEAQLNFNLKKPLPPEEIAISYSARLTNVESTQIVPNQRFTATSLDLQGDTKGLRVAGTARLGDVEVGGEWRAELGPNAGGRSTVDGWLTVTETIADQFNLGLPPGALAGSGRADIRLDLAKGQAPTFRLSSDLAGIALKLDALNWSMSRAQVGAFEVAGELSTPPSIESISLSAPGLSAKGRLSLHPDGALDAARFDRVRLRDWLDAPVLLSGRGKGVAPKVVVNGGSVDLRRIDLGNSSGEGGPLTVTLDELRVTDTIVLRGMRGEFTNAGGLSGQFAANLNGVAPISGTVVPQRGRSAVRILADDAGAVLSAAGLLQKGRGGTLDLSLSPVDAPGSYDGLLKVRDITLEDAPAMASLLSALSIVGLLEQMSGGGIPFTEVDANFRLTPQQVILRSSSATGASMGVSMDGVYDLNAKRMDMQGVISPIYMLNGIGQIFTRKGEGLLGFNYRLFGAVANPRVNVNPLSIFTPGMFREIFRRPAPTTN